MKEHFYIYMLASEERGTIYIGVTSDLIKRIGEHKSKTIKGFTKRYDVTQLVYYEVHDSSESALMREKQIKEWKRQWKINLIEEENPHWHDLYDRITS